MLELQNITKHYGTKLALDHVSLTLKNGIYGLLGPNGAGKSTLMNIITGNLKPTSGRVLWDGKNVFDCGAAYRSLLGYAPQQQGLYDTFTGIRFLSYMATLKGIPKKEQKGEIWRVLDYVNLTEKAYRPIGTYSGGMKQRILVAQAISGDKIILVSTHVVSDIESIAKEIILLREGKIVDHDTVPSLCRKHGDVQNLEQVYLQVFGEEEIHDGSHTI